MLVNLGFPVLFLTRWFLFFVFIYFFTACFYTKHRWASPPKNQRFVDKSQFYLPTEPKSIALGIFATINRDSLSDLFLLPRHQNQANKKIFAYISMDRKKFFPHLKNGLSRDFKINIKLVLPADLNQDGFSDLIFLGIREKKYISFFLLNNKKGYYYFPRHPFPQIKNGVEHIQAVDIDHDGDQDLLFFGKALFDFNGSQAFNNIQLMINRGNGQFKDETSLLLPILPSGIIAASIADYDGDQVPDIFWVQRSGGNILWINNGLGKFSDQSSRALPFLRAQNVFADWADFDMDGDNDLLLVTKGIPNQYREYKNEYCFFLENDSRGIFKKRSLKLLPAIPSHRVYLLDADANKVPDIIILSRKGVHFLMGRGPWRFSDETIKRLPFSARFDEMSFGDVNGDGSLDILGILSSNKTARIWINHSS